MVAVDRIIPSAKIGFAVSIQVDGAIDAVIALKVLMQIILVVR